jgi:hypothetical protein
MFRGEIKPSTPTPAISTLFAKGAPLIKFYQFTPLQNTNTCYDGRREFTHPIDSKVKNGRFYPDEFLITTILNKYIATRLANIPKTNKEFLVIEEEWFANEGRSGGKNTADINQLILDNVRDVTESGATTLILVPFLYGDHHPGIAIDVKNKSAIYIDPYGNPTAVYPETLALQRILEREGFHVEHVQIQQQSDLDETSCGPILTSSLIKFAEEFLKHEKISTFGFETNKKNLATDRMFQIYLNNTIEYDTLVNEIMLADENLWHAFLIEQKLRDKALEEELIETIAQHKAYIKSLKEGWHLQPEHQQKVQLIHAAESRLIEVLFLKSDDMHQTFQNIMSTSKKILTATTDADLNSIKSVLNTEPKLLQSAYFKQTKKTLHLDSAIRHSIAAELFKAILDNYQSTSWLSCFSFFNAYRSTAIRELRKLSNHKIVTKSQIADALNKDSKRRVSLFMGIQQVTNHTSTDDIIVKLQQAFVNAEMRR